MNNNDLYIRCAAINLLGYLTEIANRVGPTLFNQFEGETSTEVRICVIESLKTLWENSYTLFQYANSNEYETFFSKVVEDTTLEFPLRVTASMCYCDIPIVLDGPSPYFRFSSLPDIVGEVLTQEFLSCDDDIRKLIIIQKMNKPNLLSLLNNSEITVDDAHLIVRGLLAEGTEEQIFRFPSYDKKHLGNFYPIQHDILQRETLIFEAILNADKFWEIPTNLLSEFYNLPDSREKLRVLVDQIERNAR